MSAVSLSLERLKGATSKASKDASRLPQRHMIKHSVPAVSRPWAELANYTNIAYRDDPISAFQQVASSHSSEAAVFYEVECSDSVISVTDSDNDLRDFVDKLIVMPYVSSLDECIDVIFEKFNDLQDKGEFSQCDDALYYLLQQIKKIEPTLLVSFLVITLAAKSKLRFRVALYEAVESVFLMLFDEDRIKRILVGLK
jgi:hypothetical protein